VQAIGAKEMKDKVDCAQLIKYCVIKTYEGVDE
jgi:hypothetical protein